MLLILVVIFLSFSSSARPCVDIREECPLWATTLFNVKSGTYELSREQTECIRDRSYMTQYCPKSCGFCSEDQEGSCADYGCGSFNPSHDCQCNSNCESYGDCCSDYKETCGSSEGTCAVYGCGSFDRSHDCQCNSDCDSFGDCCSDYEETCGSGGKGSCKEYGCNTSYNPQHSCQCNSACQSHDDCCSDYQDECGGGGQTVGCPKAPTKPQDRRISKETLKVVTWNVDWLFTNVSHDQGQIVCPGDCDWKNESIALEHLKTVTNNLETIGADIMLLEETEDCDTLASIIAGMADGAYYKPYNHLSADTYTGQNPGCISKIDPMEDLYFSPETVKYPVNGSTCPKKYSGSHGNSKHFRARFNLQKFNLTIIVTHLLAIPDDNERCPEREAQATVLAHLVEQAKQDGDEILVTGDFNDYDDSVSDVNGNKPISSALKIIRDAGNLTNLASQFDVSERYTDWYDRNRNCIDDGGNEHSMIDHILLSPMLLSHVKDSGALHNFENHCDCLYSDHWPVWVEFDFSDLN